MQCITTFFGKELTVSYDEVRLGSPQHYYKDDCPPFIVLDVAGLVVSKCLYGLSPISLQA